MTSSEFKQSARALVKLRLDLDKKAKAQPTRGYFKNWYGTYWEQTSYDRALDLYRVCASINPDPMESMSDRYALAAFLRDGLRLDEAAEVCAALMSERPGRALADMHLLAYIEARRGNIQRARELAGLVNDDQRSRSFRVNEDDLMREFSVWRLETEAVGVLRAR